VTHSAILNKLLASTVIGLIIRESFSGKVMIRESSFWETSRPGKNHPGKLLSGKWLWTFSLYLLNVRHPAFLARSCEHDIFQKPCRLRLAVESERHHVDRETRLAVGDELRHSHLQTFRGGFLPQLNFPHFTFAKVLCQSVVVEPAFLFSCVWHTCLFCSIMFSGHRRFATVSDFVCITAAMQVCKCKITSAHVLLT